MKWLFLSSPAELSPLDSDSFTCCSTTHCRAANTALLTPDSLTEGPPGLESFFGLVHQKWLSKWLRMEVFSTSVVMLHKLRQNERWGVCPYMRGNLNKVCFLFKEVWRVVPQTDFWKEVGKWSDFLKTALFFFFLKSMKHVTKPISVVLMWPQLWELLEKRWGLYTLGVEKFDDLIGCRE